jgi:exosortase family protein XrtM
VAGKRFFLQDVRLFWHAHQPEIRFTIWFLVILAGLNYLYYILGGTSVENFVLAVMTAKPPALIINFITPAEHVVVNGTELTSPSVSFSVVSGCEGMGGVLLIISAICAAKVRLRGKLTGVLYGVTFIYLLNILRIVGLYYVMRYYNTAFNFAHYFVGQTIIIVLGCAFFVLWISRNTGPPQESPSP